MVTIVQKESLRGTARHVRNQTYETVRLLLAEDGAEATVTDIVLAPDVEETYGSDQRIEIAYCIEGDAELTDLASGVVHRIIPGVLWVAQRGERFRFRASVPTRLVCVFVPPFSGEETGFARDA